MNTRLTTYAPLLLSLALAAMIILLVLRIVSFSDAVTSYYTPTILNFENLLEGSQHLKIAAEGEKEHKGRESIAAKHFIYALDRLTAQANTAWPKAHSLDLREIISMAGHVREELLRENFAEVDKSLGQFMPILAQHTQEHYDELNRAKRNIHILTISVGMLSLLLIALGYTATRRERRVAELLTREKDVEHIIRHDLKSPLAGLISVPLLLMDDENLTTDQRQMLGMVAVSGRKMLNQINSTLELRKVEDGTYTLEPQECYPVKLARENIEILVVSKGIEPALFLVREHGPTTEGSGLVVQTDGLLLDIILMNLLRNAVEASDSGSRVLVDISADDKECAIAISNSRVVPVEIRERFFDKYVTRGKVGGTGLGTYSAAIMTRAIRGTISMETSEESGTTVTVRIPIRGRHAV